MPPSYVRPGGRRERARRRGDREDGQERKRREHEAVQLVPGGAELAGRFGKREDEDAGRRGRQSDAPAGLHEAAAREPVLADPLLRRCREAVERAAVETATTGKAANASSASPSASPNSNPTQRGQDEHGGRRDRARADDERGRDRASGPEQQRQRVVRLDVVHLADEEERGAEEKDAEQVERLADPRPALRPVAEVVAGRVRPGDRDRQQGEPDAGLAPPSWRRRSRSRRARPRPRRSRRARSSRCRAVPPAGPHTGCGSPPPCLAEMVSSATHARLRWLSCPANEAVRHLLRGRRLGERAVGDVDERCGRVAFALRCCRARSQRTTSSESSFTSSCVAYTVQPPMNAVSRHSSLCSPSRRLWM